MATISQARTLYITLSLSFSVAGDSIGLAFNALVRGLPFDPLYSGNTKPGAQITGLV